MGSIMRSQSHVMGMESRARARTFDKTHSFHASLCFKAKVYVSAWRERERNLNLKFRSTMCDQRRNYKTLHSVVIPFESQVWIKRNFNSPCVSSNFDRYFILFSFKRKFTLNFTKFLLQTYVHLYITNLKREWFLHFYWKLNTDLPSIFFLIPWFLDSTFHFSLE